MKNQADKPIRILHITEMLSAAGIESFIMNIYRRIDRTSVQFDFLVLRNELEFYDDEIKALGGKKYWIQSTKHNTLLRIFDEANQIENFLNRHSYNIVHVHYTTPLRAPYLKAIARAGVNTRIYHSHSAYVSGKNIVKLLIYEIMRKQITKWATDYLACSQAAAEWIYEKKLIKNNKTRVVYNGIDTSKFSYDKKNRELIRSKYRIENQFILIHTGRFEEQKNHIFVIKVFNELKKSCPEAKLMLLGSGKLLNEIKLEVKKLGIDNDVLFLGVKSDVFRYLSAADCYIMPSLYEGLPVAAVEAECSGLPCLFSTNITKEVALIDEIAFLSLEASIEDWVDQILKFRKIIRCDKSELIKQKGYDIQTVADEMQHFYLST